jgi:hypothetical protein
MAVVDKADREVVPEFGVPLRNEKSISVHVSLQVVETLEGALGPTHGPRSDGVTGSDGGGGRLMSVGADILLLKSRIGFGNSMFVSRWRLEVEVRTSQRS